MSHGGDIFRNRVNTDFSVNLNPLGTPGAVMEAVRASLGNAAHYPDPEQEEVRSAIARSAGLDMRCVYAGNGASELIMAAVRAVSPKRALLFEPAFAGYGHALRAAGCEIVRQTLSAENGFALTRKDAAALGEGGGERIDLVFLCDPANPTGVNIDEEVLTLILDAAEENGTFVCLDESFFLMSEKAARKEIAARADLVRKYSRLFIVRSLTKILALPGIRTGYLLSCPDNIDGVRRQLPEWNLPVTGEAAIREGIRILGETDYVHRALELIRAEREFLTGELRGLGIEVLDSDTSFLLLKGPCDLYEELLAREILIRDCSDFEGLSGGYYRIAVKSRQDNEKFIRIVREIMHGGRGKKVMRRDQHDTDDH